jgi:hypothetical protein
MSIRTMNLAVVALRVQTDLTRMNHTIVEVDTQALESP